MKCFSLIFLFLFVFIFPSICSAANIILESVELSEYYTVKVSIQGLGSTSCKTKTCYLQGMFTSATGSPRYFGFTFGQKDWFPYIGSPEQEYIKTNFIPFDTSPEGSWSGVVRLSLDKDDPDYKGSGQYIIKVKRYTGESSSPASDEINLLTINVSDPTPTTTASPTQAPTAETAPTATIATPTSAPTIRLTATSTVTTIPTATRTITAPPTTTPTQKTTPNTVTPASNPAENQGGTVDTNSIPEEVLGSSTSSAEINLIISSDEPVASPSPTLVLKNTQKYKLASTLGIGVTVISFGVLFLRFKGLKYINAFKKVS